MNYYPEYSLGILLFNVSSYLLLVMSLFLTMFMFNLRKFKVLSEFNQLSSFTFVKSSFILLMLSLAGIPPLFGFCWKFLMFSLVLTKNIWIIVIWFTILNFFVMLFYLQNIRFSSGYDIKNIFIIKNNKIYINYNLVSLLVLFNTVNTIGLLFVEYFLIFFNLIVSFKNLY